jgi:hypothetical protein
MKLLRFFKKVLLMSENRASSDRINKSFMKQEDKTFYTLP